MAKFIGNRVTAYQGDCVEVLREHVRDASIGLALYSPPFSNLYAYSDDPRDMGNTANDAEFFTHYNFLLPELFRVLMPGRHAAVHCSDLPLQQWKDGRIGLKDFPGALIRAHEAAGFVLHARVTIWKCPVVEVTRTKTLGLLHKQLLKDSTRSRVGMPDYLLVFMKPGENPEPVRHTPEQFPVPQWQEWASPVWMTVRQTRVLPGAAAARSSEDERHLCPLQLDVIERALVLWSNPGDVVLSPFMGIGSEGAGALSLERRYVGIELKPAYYNQAVANLRGADAQTSLVLSAYGILTLPDPPDGYPPRNAT